MTDAGLSWSTQAPLTADAELEDPPVARREVWRAVSRPSTWWERIDEALRAVLDDASDGWTFEEELRDRTSWSFATAAVDYVTAGEDAGEKRLEFRRQVRNLGGDAVITSFEDVRDGPLALLQTADVVPDVVLHLDADWLDEVTSTQLRRWVSFVTVLATACSVRVVVSPIAARRLAREHSEKLPADSVQQLAQTAPDGRAHVGERTALPGDREAARDALDVLDRDGPLVATLRALATTADQMLTYDGLGRHALLADAPRETWRSRLARLRDLDLVSSEQWAGDVHHRLTTAGLLLVQEDAQERGQAPPTPGGGLREAEHTAEPESPHSGPTGGGAGDGEELAARSDPPKTSSEGRVPIRGRDGAGEDADRDAAAEGREVAATGRETGRPGPDDWMRPDRHAALQSVANGADVAVCDRPVDDVSGRRTRFDAERDQLSVSVDYSDDIAVLAVRLCAALTDPPAWNTALSQERLDGAGGDLDGLVTGNPYILRKGRCLGWLRNEDANGDGLRDRLHEERRALLAMLDDLRGEGGDYRADVASEVLNRAHGLLGTLAQLYDLLGVDVVREIRVRNYRRDVHDRRHALVKFLASAIPKSARYGHYSAHRILYEPRPQKRSNDNTLGEPDTRGDAVGEHIGSWVVSGPGADALLPDLKACAGRHYDVQEDGENFAPFEVPVDVADGWRREAVATAARRVAAPKGLETTRAVVSVLQALCGSVHDVAAAVWGLGADSEREMDLAELRPALGRLSPDRILPNVGGRTASAAVAALLAVDGRVSTSTLANRADVSTQSLRDNREVLVAVGLVDVEDGGAGEATRWRLRLPFQSERFDAGDDDVEEREPDEYPGEGDVRRPGALLLEREASTSEIVLALLEGPLLELTEDVFASDEWVSLASSYRLDSPAAESLADRWPWLRGWMEVIGALLGLDAGLFASGEWLATSSTTSRFGAAPSGSQSRLSASVAD